jgi:protein O-GlcNAc transferase
MPRVDDKQKLQTAFSLQQKGSLNEAAKLYRQLITRNPNNFYALHFLGVIEASVGNIEQAKILMARSLSIQPPNIQFVENYAAILFQIGDYETALQICQKALQLVHNNASLLYVSAISMFKLKKLQESLVQFDKLLLLQPDHIAALNERGSALAEMKQYDAALASIDKALTLNPHYAEAHLNKGNLCSELERFDDAIAAYGKAIDLSPALANAWLGRGNIFRELKRYDEASAAYGNALALNPDLADAWVGRGNVYFDLKRHDDAFAAYDKALALKSILAEAWLGRGNIYFDHKRRDDALAAYDKALALKPSLAGASLGRGNVFVELKRFDEAFAAYDKTLALKPDFAEVWNGRGNAFSQLKRYDEAFAAYDKALALKPDLTGVENARFHTKMQLCDWSNIDADYTHFISSVRNGKVNTMPFSFLAIPSSSADQLQCAKLWIANTFPPSDKPIWQGEQYDHDRIRIAYLSADFRDHPMSDLMAGIFECHDKSHFETIAISLGPDDNSEIRKRLEAAFERFIDVRTYSDDRIADLIKKLEINILVDLMGFTAMSRTGIFAKRPVPIQVSYLGYPGTMGAEFINYIIADQIVIPENQDRYYSEKVVRLPDSYYPTSYQINDARRSIPDRAFTRAELGLPQTGFVFCCFNQNYKMAPRIFDCWMRILKQVEGSILWLLEDNATSTANLRTEAVVRGVNAERLIFAPRMPRPDHLARNRLADLLLDTLPYNAHTTASDALWSGVPVLTCRGETFAGRVAASLLTAINLPELITTTQEAYAALAIELATQPSKLADIKQKLAKNRLSTPLFNTKLFTRHIEAAYNAMYERHQACLAPDHIVVPN